MTLSTTHTHTTACRGESSTILVHIDLDLDLFTGRSMLIISLKDRTGPDRVPFIYTYMCIYIHHCFVTSPFHGPIISLGQ